MAYKAKGRKDRKTFKTTAAKSNKMNAVSNHPRGGIRL